MSSHDLQRQLSELRAQVEALQPTRAADTLAPYFADSAYDGHRAAILAALLAGRPYAFRATLPGDAEAYPSRFLVSWPRRDQPPLTLCIRYVAHWRETGSDGYAELVDTINTYHRPTGTFAAAPDDADDADEQSSAIASVEPSEPARVAPTSEPPVPSDPPTPPAPMTVEALVARMADLRQRSASLLFGRDADHPL